MFFKRGKKLNQNLNFNKKVTFFSKSRYKKYKKVTK